MADKSSPSRVAGKVIREITISGDVYTLSQPQRVGDIAEEEAIVLSRRQDPLVFAVRACQQMPANRHASVWEGCAAAAMRGIPTDEEWEAYEASLWKPAFKFWKALDPKHYEGRVLLEGVRWALGLLREMEVGEFKTLLQLVAIVNQDAAIKNSAGPTETSGQAP